eukprot:11192452-Lingulodinium_polyedra.AAC.1
MRGRACESTHERAWLKLSPVQGKKRAPERVLAHKDVASEKHAEFYLITAGPQLRRSRGSQIR